MRKFALLMVVVAFGAAASPARADFASDFAQPAHAVQPKFRWWWPNALVDTNEIKAEIDQMAAAGFGGAEITDVHHSISSGLDPAGHGWGTQAWVDATTTAFREAKARGMTLDLTAGPSWPAAVPSITPDSPAAIKELAYGLAPLAPGQAFSGPAPAPVVAPAATATAKKLVYVQAAKYTTAGAPPKTAYTLDPSTLQTLT